MVDLQGGAGFEDVKVFFVHAVLPEEVDVVIRAHAGCGDDAVESSLICHLGELLCEVVAGVPMVPVADVAGGVSGPIYAYIGQGIRVTIDTYTHHVLKVEYDLDPDALDDWYFIPQAIDDCKHLNTTPVAVVDSIDDAQPYPAASMCTIYRGAYDILVNEPKGQIISIKPSGTLTSTDHQGIRRISGGTPTGSMPTSTTELLNRARRAGFAVSVAGSGHHKIWGSGTSGQGLSVTIPATASDHRGLLNAVMQIRSTLGVDLRLL